MALKRKEGGCPAFSAPSSKLNVVAASALVMGDTTVTCEVTPRTSRSPLSKSTLTTAPGSHRAGSTSKRTTAPPP